MNYKIFVPDMHCIKCAERIKNAFSLINLSIDIDLDEKTVTINGSEENLKTALSELEDLGFSPNI